MMIVHNSKPIMIMGKKILPTKNTKASHHFRSQIFQTIAGKPTTNPGRNIKKYCHDPPNLVVFFFNVIKRFIIHPENRGVI